MEKRKFIIDAPRLLAVDASFANQFLAQSIDWKCALGVSKTAPSTVNKSSARIAVIYINGYLSKYLNLFFRGSSYLELAFQINMAAADSGIAAIALVIDSPGGDVKGLSTLCESIKLARNFKRVFAYCDDLTASAAFRIASCCDQIFANSESVIGSIGTYVFLLDLSQSFGRAGIKPILIKAGEYKGMGAPGTEIDEKQQAEMQRLVDQANLPFLQDVKAGRRSMSDAQFKQVWNGRVFYSSDALNLKLIDGIMSLDDFFNMIRNDSSVQRIVSMRAQVEREKKAEAERAEKSKCEQSQDQHFKNLLEHQLKLGKKQEAAVDAILCWNINLHGAAERLGYLQKN